LILIYFISPELNYQQLVLKRKYFRPLVDGLINQQVVQGAAFDKGEFLEPWAKWHNAIPAKILLVGQDWGGVNYFISNGGRDDECNPTCRNLSELFKEINIDIGTPKDPNKTANVHFTNIIPFLRTGPMQGSLEKILTQDVINEYAYNFTGPLIAIVEPRIIITLGKSAFRGIASLYGIDIGKRTRLRDFTEQCPLQLTESILLFPMFHCGSSGVNRSRKMVIQKSDWLKIAAFL
jgi:hypothetical protein